MKEKSLSRFFSIIAVGILLFSISAIGHAEIPETLSYQGYLTDSTSGNPIDSLPGTIPITFSIYDVVTGGTALWSETLDVSVNQGVYSVQLGSMSSLMLLNFDVPYWLGLTVGTDGEMDPRQPFNSVPFALNSAFADFATDADTLDGQDSAIFATTSHSHGSFEGNVEVTGNLDVIGTLTAPGIGDITAVTAGTGIIGGGTSADVTLNVDTSVIQQRVSEICTEGSSIRTINSDGTVMCETDNDVDTTYQAGNGLTLNANTFTIANTLTLYPISSNPVIEVANFGSGWGIYATASENDAIFADGNITVTGYTKIGLLSGPPPAADCNDPSEHGRMKVDSRSGINILYVCVEDGWIGLTQQP